MSQFNKIEFSLQGIVELAEKSNKNVKVKVGREIAYSSERSEDSIQDLASQFEFIDSLVNSAISQPISAEGRTDNFTKEKFDHPSFSVEIQGIQLIHFQRKKGFKNINENDLNDLLSLSDQEHVEGEQQEAIAQPDEPNIKAEVEATVEAETVEVPVEQEDDQVVLNSAEYVEAREFPTMEEAHPEAIAQSDEPHIDAASVGLIQFAEVLPEAQIEWLVDKVEGFKQSGIAQAVMEYGVPTTKAAIDKTRELGASTRERGLADSLASIMEEFGSDYNNDGAVGFDITVAETEKYVIARREEAVGGVGGKSSSIEATYFVLDKDTFHSLEEKDSIISQDRAGFTQVSAAAIGTLSANAVVEFQYDKLKGPTFQKNDLSITDQFDVLKAGAVVAKDRTQQAAKDGWAIAKKMASRAKDDTLVVKAFGEDAYEKMQGVADKLGNMAPAGTRKAIQQFKAKKIDDIAQSLTSSKAAVQQAGKTVFEGAQLTFEKARSDVGEQVKISAKGGQELFSRTTEKVTGGVKTSIKNRLSQAGMKNLFQKAKQLNLGVGGKSSTKPNKSKVENKEMGR